MTRRPPSGLLLITDRRQGARPPAEVCGAALAGGFSAIMVREKDLPAADLYAIVRAVLAAARGLGAPVLVNDRIDVALALPGVGAHVGAAGLQVARARALLGHDRILGYSAHAPEEAEKALEEGADYVTVSPLFVSPSKPGLAPRGLALLTATLAVAPPARVFGLGGIDRDTVAGVAGTGAGGAAVMGAVMRAEDPRAAAAELVARWNEARIPGAGS